MKKPGSNGTAAATYRETLIEVRRDLAVIDNALADHRTRQKADPKNWSHVGDLNHVRELLAGITAFLGVEAADDLHCDHADGLCRESIGKTCDGR